MSSPGGAHRADAQPPADPRREADAPKDVEAARERVEATREELGQTVAALAEKVDVKTRTRGKAVAVKERAGRAAGQAAHTARSKAAAVKDRAASRRSGSTGPPEAGQVRTADAPASTRTVADTLKQRPVALALIGGALAVAGLVVWWRQR
jgi:hypothetical protein